MLSVQSTFQVRPVAEGTSEMLFTVVLNLILTKSRPSQVSDERTD